MHTGTGGGKPRRDGGAKPADSRSCVRRICLGSLIRFGTKPFPVVVCSSGKIHRPDESSAADGEARKIGLRDGNRVGSIASRGEKCRPWLVDRFVP